MPREYRYNPTLILENEMLILETRSLTNWILNDLKQNIDVTEIALSFHHWLLEGSIKILVQLREQTGIDTVVLGGGAMQNKILLEGLLDRCKKQHFKVFSGEQVPVNDGGIALGQAYIAGAMGTTLNHSQKE